jgi:peptidoglycan/xylan/chitin deacetylase (PgdA/CDA1 family)
MIRKIDHLNSAIFDHKPRILIFTYHRVLPEITFNPFDTVISLKAFNKQINFLAQKYAIISLKDAVKQLTHGQLNTKMQIVLSFDDGYRDNYEIVYPILKKMGIPAVFFIIANYINSNSLLWDVEIAKILSENRKRNKVKIANQIIKESIFQSRDAYIISVIKKIKALTHRVRQEVLDSIREYRDRNEMTGYWDNCFMSWDNLKIIAENGIEIGSHGLNHYSLSMLPLEDAIYEINQSKKIIEHHINSKCSHFAFPYGARGDFNETLIDYIRQAGYQSCLLNIQGYNRITNDLFRLKRFIVNDSTNFKDLL